MTRIRLGVSSCLGHAVRFDGDHERNAFLGETLVPPVEWVSVCPEVGAGFPVRRPAEEEGRLHDPVLRAVFIERNYAQPVLGHGVRTEGSA